METTREQSGTPSHIFIDESHHLTYQELAKRSENQDLDEGKDTPPFESMKNLFMLATFIGYHHKKRVPLKNKTEIFTWQILARDEEYLSLLYALAITETNDTEVLTDKHAILTIAEEYANAGIILIHEQVKEMPGDRIENLLDLLAIWIPPEGSIQDLVENSGY